MTLSIFFLVLGVSLAFIIWLNRETYPSWRFWFYLNFFSAICQLISIIGRLSTT